LRESEHEPATAGGRARSQPGFGGRPAFAPAVSFRGPRPLAATRPALLALALLALAPPVAVLVVERAAGERRRATLFLPLPRGPPVGVALAPLHDPRPLDEPLLTALVGVSLELPLLELPAELRQRRGRLAVGRNVVATELLQLQPPALVLCQGCQRDHLLQL